MRKLKAWAPLECALLVAAAPLSAQHRNVLVSNLNYPNEPCIAIDPNNTNRMVAAANLNNFYYSSDAGLTWTAGRATSTYGVWGDPVVVADYEGSFYYFHLSNPPNGNWIDRIVCQKSTDGGKSWSKGTFMGLVPIATATTIAIDLHGSTPQTHVQISVYNLTGQRIRTIYDGIMPRERRFRIKWDGRNDFAQQVSSGVYFVQSRLGNLLQTKRILFFK